MSEEDLDEYDLSVCDSEPLIRNIWTAPEENVALPFSKQS